MRAAQTLGEAFSLLAKKPKLFIPKLFASAIYAFFQIAFIFFAAGLFRDMATYADPREAVMTAAAPFLLFALAYLLLVVVDVITYAMYPSLVADFRRGGGLSLSRSLGEALKAWRVLLSLGSVFLAVFVLMIVFLALLGVAAQLLDNVWIILIGGVFFILVVLVVMLMVFFVLPVGVIEKAGIFESFRRSFGLGAKYREEVFLIEVVVVAMVVVAFFVGVSTGFEGSGAGLTAAALAVFLLGRFLQSVLYAYVCVVNPLLYLNLSAGEKA